MGLRTDKEIWKEDYLDPMFKKYESVSTKLKYLFIEKDYARMFGGKREAESRMKYMYDDTETFIFAFENALCEFGKVARKNLIKKYWEDLALDEYYKLLKSGMLWEIFPQLSGEWLQDKEYFVNFVAERENKKEYVNLIYNTKPQ